MQYLAPKDEDIWRKTDKNILLIGGGQSNIRRWLKKIGNKSKITNVDFYTHYKSTVSHTLPKIPMPVYIDFLGKL